MSVIIGKYWKDSADAYLQKLGVNHLFRKIVVKFSKPPVVEITNDDGLWRIIWTTNIAQPPTVHVVKDQRVND